MSVTCPVCRASDAAACYSAGDRLFGLAGDTFNLFRCAFCKCTFLHPLPEESALAGFYPPEYWWSEEASSGSLFSRLFRRLEKAYRESVVIADHIKFLDYCARKIGVDGKRLLDIGCGSGTFLRCAQRFGFIPHGMDMSAKAVEIVQKQYGIAAKQGGIGQNVWEGDRFNFVTMFHVLEHLPDPRLALKFAAGLLQPGGTLILQVPNISSLQARLFGKRWYGLDVPRHVINFSPKALGILLKEMGYEFQLVSRFSVRDNPASIASSLALWLDPIRRKGRRLDTSPVLSGLLEIAYFGLFLLALPAAFLESVCGFGGTLWAFARLKPQPE
jgi:2-polyprenyl-3-methyl-5-hydroxy-6-metoxy-1,4-benzoquinol methylase